MFDKNKVKDVAKLAMIEIDEEDLEFCEAFLKTNQTYKIRYDPILEKYLNSHEE